MGYDNTFSVVQGIGDSIMKALESEFVGSELFPINDGGCYQKLTLSGGQTICFQKWRKGENPFYIIARDKNAHNYQTNYGLLQLDLSLICPKEDGTYEWYLNQPTNAEMKELYGELFDEVIDIPEDYEKIVKKQRKTLYPRGNLFTKGYKFVENVSLDELCANVRDLFTKVYSEEGIPVSTRNKLSEPKNGSGKRATREVDVRDQQAAFRDMLLEAYSCQCAITGEGPSKALDACHLEGYTVNQNNQRGNGVLLRVDIHRLFDEGLVKINPETYVVEIDSTLKDTSYSNFDGKKIRKTVDGQYPSQEFLAIKYEE